MKYNHTTVDPVMQCTTVYGSQIAHFDNGQIHRIFTFLLLYQLLTMKNYHTSVIHSE